MWIQSLVRWSRNRVNDNHHWIIFWSTVCSRCAAQKKTGRCSSGDECGDPSVFAFGNDDAYGCNSGNCSRNPGFARSVHIERDFHSYSHRINDGCTVSSDCKGNHTFCNTTTRLCEGSRLGQPCAAEEDCSWGLYCNGSQCLQAIPLVTFFHSCLLCFDWRVLQGQRCSFPVVNGKKLNPCELNATCGVEGTCITLYSKNNNQSCLIVSVFTSLLNKINTFYRDNQMNALMDNIVLQLVDVLLGHRTESLALITLSAILIRPSNFLLLSLHHDNIVLCQCHMWVCSSYCTRKDVPVGRHFFCHTRMQSSLLSTYHLLFNLTLTLHSLQDLIQCAITYKCFGISFDPASCAMKYCFNASYCFVNCFYNQSMFLQGLLRSNCATPPVLPAYTCPSQAVVTTTTGSASTSGSGSLDFGSYLIDLFLWTASTAVGTSGASTAVGTSGAATTGSTNGTISTTTSAVSSTGAESAGCIASVTSWILMACAFFLFTYWWSKVHSCLLGWFSVLHIIHLHKVEFIRRKLKRIVCKGKGQNFVFFSSVEELHWNGSQLVVAKVQ